MITTFVASALAMSMSPLRAPRTAPMLRASIISMAGPMEVDDTWTTTGSGLQYMDEKVGDGEAPTKGNTVKVDYTGWVESSGKEFDSSRGRGPIAFNVGVSG